MLKSLLSIFVCFTILGTATLTTAEYITLSGTDGTYDMYAGDFGGILGSDDHQFSMSDLDILAATLNGDGIETMGRLSFILASTDAGVSLIGLFDGVPINNPDGSIPNQFLGVSSTTSTNTDWFATGDEGSQTDWYDMGNGTQLVNAFLGWDHGQTSAAFAWGDVSAAQSGTVNLYDIDLTEFAGDPIQFLTYQGEQWDVAGTANFSVLGQYAFSYQFVPTPGALALLTVASLVGRRRRRK
jgi:hypothetical protein